MNSIGEALKQARESKGITLTQAEEDTKIRKRYLQALEDGDYDIIPGMVYAKGFLRNYANYLGLNQDEVMIEYKLLNVPVREDGPRPDIQQVIQRRRISSRSNRRNYKATVTVAFIAILIFAVYGMFFRGASAPNAGDKGKQLKTGTAVENSSKNNQQTNRQNNEQTNQQNNQQTNQQQNQQSNTVNFGTTAGTGQSLQNQQNNPASLGAAPNPSQGNANVQIVLKGKDQSSWVKVTVDGHVDFTGYIQPGDVKTFGGDSVKFRLGNAGGVDVSVNGQEIGTLGPAGTVVDKEYSKELLNQTGHNQ